MSYRMLELAHVAAWLEVEVMEEAAQIAQEMASPVSGSEFKIDSFTEVIKNVDKFVEAKEALDHIKKARTLLSSCSGYDWDEY